MLNLENLVTEEMYIHTSKIIEENGKHYLSIIYRCPVQGGSDEGEIVIPRVDLSRPTIIVEREARSTGSLSGLTTISNEGSIKFDLGREERKNKIIIVKTPAIGLDA